jgi:peptidoglycan/LPS O-acetylase OafA/YrhL
LINKSLLIQRLRGVAIILVVFYHLGFDSFSKGYLGVDLFLVISGYVMMQSCYRRSESQKFSVTLFMVQRSVRLLPALATVIIFFIILSGIFFPSELQQTVNKTAIFGFMQLSNLYFYRTVGNYFAPDSQLNPFLHLWSLSLEFQLYVLLSIFIFFIIKLKISIRFMIFILVIFVILSFLSSMRPLQGELFYGYTFLTGFYGTPSRLWEFAIGSLIFLIKHLGLQIKISNLWVHTVSLFFILVALLPGLALPDIVNRLLLVSGTATIIWSDGSKSKKAYTSFVLLITSWLERIGKISYSIYLWHYPSITFGKLLFPFVENAHILAFLVSIPMSIFCYKFIEERTQLNFARGKILPRQVILALPIFLTVLLIVSVPVIIVNPVFKPNNQYERSDDHLALSNGCIDEPLAIEACTFNSLPKNNRGLIAVFGDSQAYAAATGVIEAAKEFQLDVFVFASSGCPFFVQKNSLYSTSRCSSYRLTASEFILKNRPEIVYIANRTTGYLTREWNWNTVDDVSSNVTTTESGLAEMIWRKNLDLSIQYLSELGIKVILQQSIPDMNRRNYIGVYQTPLGQRFPVITSSKVNQVFAETKSAVKFAKLGRNIELDLMNKYKDSMFLVDPIDVLCDEKVCPLFFEAQPIYLDWGHLSPTGSLQLVSKIRGSMAIALKVRQ